MPYRAVRDSYHSLPHYEPDMLLALYEIEHGIDYDGSPRRDGRTIRWLIERGALKCPKNKPGSRHVYKYDRATLTKEGRRVLPLATARYVAAADHRIQRQRPLGRRRRAVA